MLRSPNTWPGGILGYRRLSAAVVCLCIVGLAGSPLAALRCCRVTGMKSSCGSHMRSERPQKVAKECGLQHGARADYHKMLRLGASHLAPHLSKATHKICQCTKLLEAVGSDKKKEAFTYGRSLSTVVAPQVMADLSLEAQPFCVSRESPPGKPVILTTCVMRC